MRKNIGIAAIFAASSFLPLWGQESTIETESYISEETVSKKFPSLTRARNCHIRMR